MCSDEKQVLQVKDINRHTIKVDGTNVQNAARVFEKNMYESLRSELDTLKNKPGRSKPIPKEEKERGRTR